MEFNGISINDGSSILVTTFMVELAKKTVLNKKNCKNNNTTTVYSTITYIFTVIEMYDDSCHLCIMMAALRG